MRALLAAAAVLTLAAIPAVADPVPSTTVVAPASSEPDPKEVICKEMPAPSGSRIPAGKECHTRLEWESMQAHGADMAKMYDHSDRPATFSPPGSGGMGH